MAIRNRKLFPSFTDTNETTYCGPDFCDPTTCPYDCPTFSLYPPSLPPPPPPLPPSPSTGNTHVSPSLITASALLVGFFILIGYYFINAKSCFRRRLRNEQHPPEGGGDEENRVDHPIWLIATVGLQQSVINAITVCKYRKGDGLIEGTECSVCLSVFCEGESLRLLPKCSHAFHISCIDTWLGSHTNCPLCRANIVTPGDDVGFVSARPVVDSMAAERQQEDSRLSVEIQETEETRETEEETTLKMIKGESDPQEINDVDDVRDQKEMRQRIAMDCHSSSGEARETEQHRNEERLINVVGKGGTFTGKEGPVVVARSLSCNGGFFLSRHGRSTSSILP